MKIYANRYGMIASYELAFALQNAARRRRAAEAARSRRAAWRERWRERGQRGGRAASELLAGLRAAMLRQAT